MKRKDEREKIKRMKAKETKIMTAKRYEENRNKAEEREIKRKAENMKNKFRIT
jgi:hypothetical protein